MKLNWSKEFKIGVFSLISGVILYLGFNYLKGLDMFSSRFKLYAAFTNVQGLVVSSPVLVNGLNVGRVSDIHLESMLPNSRVIAVLEINKGTVEVLKGTTCTMISTDLLGGKALRLNAPLKVTKPMAEGDTLLNVVEAGITDKISESINPLVTSLDTISKEVQGLLHGFKKTTVLLEGTLVSFRHTADVSTQLIQGNSESLHTILANTAKLSAQLITTQKELDALLLKSGKFADTLNRMKLANTVASLNQSLEGLNLALKDINAGKGSVGKLMKSDSLYNNLNHSSAALDALLIDMKAHPARYVHFSVFGKKDK